jgi:hypothetical protein
VNKIDAAIRTAVYGSITAAACVAAFLFFVIAAFLWTQQHYDAIVACGVSAGLFLLIAVIALTMVVISRRRAAKAKQAAAHTHPWLADPAILLMAAQVVRSIGITRLLPMALAAIAAFGAADLLAGRASGNKRRTPPDQTRRAA